MRLLFRPVRLRFRTNDAWADIFTFLYVLENTSVKPCSIHCAASDIFSPSPETALDYSGPVIIMDSGISTRPCPPPANATGYLKTEIALADRGLGITDRIARVKPAHSYSDKPKEA
jgi:hypothetical protein